MGFLIDLMVVPLSDNGNGTGEEKCGEEREDEFNWGILSLNLSCLLGRFPADSII